MIMLAKRAFISFNLSLLFLLASMQVTHASSPALEAKGAAVYQELGIEYYIASLYVEDAEAADPQVIAYDGPQQIKIKVTTKRWSARKWKAQWQNNIAINNTPSSDPALNADLALFTEFPQASLIKGDEVVVAYHPASGSELLFNGHSVLTTQDKQFYSYLLNTWLGKFSPNRIFREQISGQEKLNLKLVQSSHQELDAERKQAILAWFTPQASASVNEPSDALVAASALVENQESESQSQTDVKSQKNQQRAAAQKQRKLQQEKENAEKQRLAKQQQIKQQAKKKAENDKRLKAAQEKKRLALKAQEDKKLKEAQRQQYYYDVFQWELATKVNETVSYPPWARQFNHQGVVDLTFTINRSGLILEKNIAASDVSKILIQEVENKVKLAVELLAVPKELKGDQWRFRVHYVFDLSNPEQEALVKPLPSF